MTLWQAYHTPQTVHDAQRCCSSMGDQALARSRQRYGPDPGHAGHQPPLQALVDVTRIAGLINRQKTAGSIGAAVTHAQIERSGAPALQTARPWPKAAARLAGRRRKATLGGNVAHALPAADGTIGLLALEAQAQVCTLAADGRVECAWQPLLSLFAGPGSNTLAHNQMLAAFRFPVQRPHQASAFDRIMRPQGVALPILGVAAKLTLDAAGERAIEAAIAIGPAGPIPFRAGEAEAALLAAQRCDDAAIEAAVAAAQAQAQLRTSKHRASQEYRHEMVAVLLRRVLRRAAAGAREGG